MNKAFNQLVREVASTADIQVKSCSSYDYFSFAINIHTNNSRASDGYVDGYVDGAIDMITNGVRIVIPLEKETIAVLKESIRRDK